MPQKASVLFTGQKKEKASVLLSDSGHSAILDSGCSSTVVGEQWITCYPNSLTPDELAEVKRKPSDAVFKFVGGEQIKSSEKITLPCWSAGVKCLIETDVVNSEIPLLLSKMTMKKAKMELDLVHDKAKISGKEVPLQNTSNGHYIVSMKETLVPIELSLFISQDIKQKEKKVIKLHKQFAHPSSKRLKTLLEDAGVHHSDCQKVLDKLEETRDICLKFTRTPGRPIVSLPLVTNFSEVVVMDLKEWVKGKIWFLHLLDAATHLVYLQLSTTNILLL